MGNEKERFGLIADCMGAVIKGLVLYVILLVTNFLMYQEGVGDFQPGLLLSILPYMAVLSCIYCKLDDIQCVLLHIAAGFVWGLFGILVVTNALYYVGAVLFGLGESLVQKFVLGDFDARRYSRRYKMKNYVKWGVVIALLSMLLIYYARPASEKYPIGYSVCGNYIVLAFGMYLLAIVVYQYMFLQYNYFRQRDSMDQYSYRQLKRMNGIIAIVVVLLIGIAILILNETVVRVLEKISSNILKVLIGAGVMGLSNIKTRQSAGHSYVDVPEGAMQGVSRPDSQFPVQSVGIVLILIFAVLVLKKLYKMFGANYSMGNDEAEYIVPTQKNEREYSVLEKEKKMKFDHDNRGRIRKNYYKFMNGRMDKRDADRAKTKTPTELADSYGKVHERKTLCEMTEIYEKARYSEEACTQADVNEMKQHTGQM